MKLVSVVIPVYNVEKYIEECLVSVLNQTLKDVEIICVNDGTPDHSMDIVEKYAKEDDRIVIVNKENGGLSSARNAGLRVATGKYVYFMDSDDYLLENTLEKLCAVAEEKKLDSIFFDADSFFESEELKQAQSSYVKYYHRGTICEDVLTGPEFMKRLIETDNWRPSACLQMNRREMLIENDIWFKEGIIHEDNLFSFQVSLQSKAVTHLPDRFYQRRVREDSIMTTKTALRSCYGYLQCIKKGMELVPNRLQEEELIQAYILDLSRMRTAAANTLKNMEADELNGLKMEQPEDDILFQILIKDYAKLLQEKTTLSQKVSALKKENKKIKNSRAYKIGRKLTAIPRKIKQLFKKK